MACRSISSVKSSMPTVRPKFHAANSSSGPASLSSESSLSLHAPFTDEALEEHGDVDGQAVPRSALCMAKRKLSATGRSLGTEQPGDQIALGRRVRSQAMRSMVDFAVVGSMKVASVEKVDFARTSLKAWQVRRADLWSVGGRWVRIWETSSKGRESMAMVLSLSEFDECMYIDAYVYDMWLIDGLLAQLIVVIRDWVSKETHKSLKLEDL